ncbi:MAG: hypothetical protein KA236_01900 [Verrucomicrobia bacterium]|jgi:hypothetical protein|nr:hypothetical protein [Verrucomicrobiota bacterium]
MSPPLYFWEFALMVVCAVGWYRLAAIEEDAPALVWAGLSLGVSAVIWWWLGWGLLAMILGQLVLAVGIGIFRVIRDRNR